ncbi:type II secretion system protein GspM [Methylocella silvestris]|uniref:General secretion pathway protein GspM n=1 Tax=Methylocella silvestris TaxID=199596 RepID=A0A2J7TCL4_METSI|nr:type II secretion system protein GspM [Methylocella silvestris]PNG24499.1 general secretion pathway protein GspM [Methylocella silvestris]
MNFADFSKRISQSGALAALVYVAVVIGLIVTIWLTSAGLGDAYADYISAGSRLAALEGRAGAGKQAGDEIDGSPFLEGPTITVAGAELQRRVVAAVAAVGGSVLSSQIDLQGSQASEGFVVLSTSCEVAQTALQPLLYDIEERAPFLFVEQLIIQSSQGGGAVEGKKMRVQIDVAGQWRVPK